MGRGALRGHSGSFWATLGVSFLGAALSLPLVLLDVPLLALVTVPVAAISGVAAYHFTDTPSGGHAELALPSVRPLERRVAKVSRPGCRYCGWRANEGVTRLRRLELTLRTVLAAALATQLSLMPTEAPARWLLLEQTLEGFGSDAEPEPFATRTIVGQVLVGAAAGLALSMIAVPLTRSFLPRFTDSYSDLTSTLTGVLIAFPLGFSVGRWGTGARVGHAGSFLSTFAVGLLSAALNAALLMLEQGFVLLLTVPLGAAAMIAVYHHTDRTNRLYAAPSPLPRPEERKMAKSQLPAASLVRMVF